jgi:hypothetical protein
MCVVGGVTICNLTQFIQLNKLNLNKKSNPIYSGLQVV